MSGTLLLAIPDLMFSVRVADTARTLGFIPRDVTLTSLSDAISTDVALIVIDTGQPGDWAGMIRTLKAEPTTASVPVLAYGAHVDVTASRTAVAAGVDRLVTRGKLMAELPQLLQQTARSVADHDASA